MFDGIKKSIKNFQLNRKQKKIKKLCEKEGLTDEVLEAQVEINTLRNELDIPDSNEIIYDKFVQ